jgi:hypothetical protein
MFFTLIMGGFIGHTAYKKHYRDQGRQIIVQESITQGTKINAEAKKARDSIKPGTAGSELLKRYSRDSK